MADPTGRYLLRWHNHDYTLMKSTCNSLSNASLVDCTLSAEGQFLDVHRLVLSACSPYFESLLSRINLDKHPVIVLKDVTFIQLQMLVDYMYEGTVKELAFEQVCGFFSAAASLKIKGLGAADNFPPTNGVGETSVVDLIRIPAPNQTDTGSLLSDPVPAKSQNVESTKKVARRKHKRKPKPIANREDELVPEPSTSSSNQEGNVQSKKSIKRKSTSLPPSSPAALPPPPPTPTELVNEEGMAVDLTLDDDDEEDGEGFIVASSNDRAETAFTKRTKLEIDLTEPERPIKEEPKTSEKAVDAPAPRVTRANQRRTIKSLTKPRRVNGAKIKKEDDKGIPKKTRHATSKLSSARAARAKSSLPSSENVDAYMEEIFKKVLKSPGGESSTDDVGDVNDRSAAGGDAAKKKSTEVTGCDQKYTKIDGSPIPGNSVNVDQEASDTRSGNSERAIETQASDAKDANKWNGVDAGTADIDENVEDKDGVVLDGSKDKGDTDVSQTNLVNDANSATGTKITWGTKRKKKSRVSLWARQVERRKPKTHAKMRRSSRIEEASKSASDAVDKTENSPVNEQQPQLNGSPSQNQNTSS